MKHGFRTLALLGAILLSACGYGDFEKSPFDSAHAFVYEHEAYVVFRGVTALEGNQAKISLDGDIVVTVDESLETGTAGLSGSTKKSINEKFRTPLKSATIFFSFT